MRLKREVYLGAVLAVSVMISAGYLSAADTEWNLTGPYSFENLSVFLIHTIDTADAETLVPLDEAIEKGYVTVFETGTVGELQIENTSEWPVFIQTGSIVKGGRQDRLLPHDVVVAARSGKKPLASFCVEQSRWSARGKESDAVFQVAPCVIADREIIMAAKVEKSQSKVWEEVAAKEEQLSLYVRGGRAGSPVSPTSLPMTLENEQVQDKTKAYVDSITSQVHSCTDAVGLVVAINGEISNADIYRGPILFTKLLPKLIDAAAVEALSKSADEVASKSVALEEVRDWLRDAGTGDAQTKCVGSTMYLRSVEGDKAISFESLSDTTRNQWIHRSILSK